MGISILKPFQFVSLALSTQGVLLLNQIVLLPIQIRVWGTDSTAYWYSTLALAAVTTAADLGLRTAGHAEIVRSAQDQKARSEFQHLWAWIRILVSLITVALIALDILCHDVQRADSYPVWRAALVIGIALETLVIIRVGYLDSLGLYREAEAGYLLLAAARLILAVSALIFFHASPILFAWIWFFTGVFAVAQQNRLCHRLGLLSLFERIPPGFSFRTLAIARHTMADPCSNWVRINAPVLVLAAIAQPMAITIYVALRAVFGAARTTISQLSRYASVEYLSLRESRQLGQAEIQITLCVMLAAFSASALTALVIADNFRLASVVLVGADGSLYQEMAIAFGLGSAFYSYQIMQAVIRRAGEVVQIANRQYLFIIYSALFAVVALVTKSTLLWLLLLLAADIMISLSFMLKAAPGSIQAQTSAGRRGCLAATASSILCLVMWLTVRFENLQFLRESNAWAAGCTAAFFLLWLVLIAAVHLCLMHDLFAKMKTPEGAVLAAWRSVRSAKLQNE